MRARSVRRTHPGVSRRPRPQLCRPREIGRPCADGPPPPDATFVAQIVLHMSHAHGADERIDRVLDDIVTGLRTQGAPAR